MIEQLLHEHDSTSATLRNALATIVLRDKEELAEIFYRDMLQDAEASKFLSAKSVESHLKPGLCLWLKKLLCHDSRDELKAALAMQRHVGEVHARADIPIKLVARGIRLLKREINGRLVDTTLAPDELVKTILYADRLIDIAFEEMSAAFAHSRDSGVKVDEGFRLFAAAQNLSLEREKQVSALLDWENRIFRALATDMPLDESSAIENSAFGLWFHHKASLLFSEADGLGMIDEIIQRIDHSILPQIYRGNGGDIQSAEGRTLIKAIMSDVGHIRYLLGEMFERLADLDVGRDALTHIFNRRFLPTILKREIAWNRKKGDPFHVLMLDIDYFKRVNDEHGHDSGDRVLQAVAGLLINQVRASDFVFRYGGEEFLIVLAKVGQAQAREIAEKIRRCVEEAEIPISNNRSIKVTLSVGVAGSDGHPDYQRILDRADKALYAAKHGGRNRCELAQD